MSGCCAGGLRSLIRKRPQAAPLLLTCISDRDNHLDLCMLYFRICRPGDRPGESDCCTHCVAAQSRPSGWRSDICTADGPPLGWDFVANEVRGYRLRLYGEFSHCLCCRICPIVEQRSDRRRNLCRVACNCICSRAYYLEHFNSST